MAVLPFPALCGMGERIHSACRRVNTNRVVCEKKDSACFRRRPCSFFQFITKHAPNGCAYPARYVLTNKHGACNLDPMQTKSLREFIKDHGFQRAALIFGVKPRTVESWYYRARSPRVHDIPALVARSGGELSFESFFMDRAA